MAIYHFAAKAVSMGKGESAVHRAAYHARTQLVDERNAKDTRDYAEKGDLAWSGIFAPKDAPDWTRDRNQLWNRAEKAERQANGQPARNIELALPNELTRQQQTRLLTDFVREQFARKGMIADANLHSDYDADGVRRAGVSPSEPRNDHAHILLTMRRLDGGMFAKTKIDAREWNSKESLAAWREGWAKAGAKALQKAGFEVEAQRFVVGHLTLPEQRQAALDRGDAAWAEQLDREPDVKQGAAVSQMEARGQTTERGETRRAVFNRNAERGALRAEAEIIDLQLERLKRQEQAEAEREQAKADAAGQQRAAREEAARGRREQARIARERDRFDAWANGKRADLQRAQHDATGEQGLAHAAQRQELDAKVRADYGPLATRMYAERAAILARQAKATGLRGLAYRLIGRAAKDATRATQIKATISNTGERALERMDALAARQARQVEALTRRQARDAGQLEQRIENARARREQEGWKGREAAKGKEAAKGGKDSQQPGQQRQPVRREATTGREIEDPADAARGIDREAEISSVDAVNDPGHQTTPEVPDAIHGPELRQGEDIPERQRRTPAERAARIEAERQAREERERDNNADHER
jgi:hypothetical protein